MKNKTFSKLRSRTGASISFALLLFLVCTVLCSVILAAATTAAGRMSKAAETDQRYYAVTSACELMKNLINNKVVSIVKVTTSTATTTYTNGMPGSPEQNNDASYVTYLIPNKTAIQLTPADYVTIIDGEGFSSVVISTIPEDAAYKLYFDTVIESDAPRKFSLASSDDLLSSLGADKDKDPLAVDIEELLDDKGTITLSLRNTTGSPFTLKMVFTASINQGVSESSSDGAAYDIAEEEKDGAVTTTYKIDTTTIKTETTTLIWTLAGVETVSGPVS